jgi:restriction system protein
VSGGDWGERAREYQQLESLRRQERWAERQAKSQEKMLDLAQDEARAASRERAERARQAEARARAETRERLRIEAQRRHVEAMQAEANARTQRTISWYRSLETILSMSLDVDDHVDLERFRVHAPHPPHPRPDLLTPVPPPAPLVAPPEPVYVEPPPPSGFGKLLAGDENRHIKKVYDAQIAHQQAHHAWQAEVASLPARQAAQDEAHRQAEAARLAELAPIQAAWEAECRRLDEPLGPQNAELDAFIAALEAGDENAVEQYIAIVVTTSPYPQGFPVTHTYEYDAAGRHLSIWVGIPHPDLMPPYAVVRYDESRDQLYDDPIDGLANDYARAAHLVALRTLHVAFECDRRGLIQQVSVSVGVSGTDPALGQPRWYPLVEVEQVGREAFGQVNLRNIEPLATLDHFGARISPSMLDLAPPGSGFSGFTWSFGR